MHISKVELDNIKSHVDSTFEFAKGTTAITGENGAGKTTIIEAIAWVLFDLLEYKKEDFVRRGAKRGAATITFESGLDEREYVVYRDSGAAYHVTDPRLQTRIADKKEEVFRFLWLHLGLEPGTDLRSLFRQAIGVPQGTFTAIFLEGATERKIAFDRLLKVEEYRQAAEKLRETSRFLDAGLSRVREDIARAEGELTRFETVEQEHKNYVEQVKKLEKEIDLIGKDLAAARGRVSEMDAKEQKTAAVRARFERLTSEKEKAELILGGREQDLERAARASAMAESARVPAERHIEILGHFSDLERRRERRDQLLAGITKIETAIVNVLSDQKRLNENLENIQKLHLEIESLRPKVAEQETVESDLAGLRANIESARTTGSQIILSFDEKLNRLRDSFRLNKARSEEVGIKVRAAGDPAVVNVTDPLQTERSSVVLEEYEQRERELTLEGKRLNAEKAALEKQADSLGEAERLLDALEAKLKVIVDQRARMETLSEEVTRETGIRENLSKVEAQLFRLESDRGQLLEQMESFKDLDEQWAAFVKERDATQEAYRIFLANETEARALGERQTQLETAKKDLAAVAAWTEELEKELAAAGVDYDRELHITEKALLLDKEKLYAKARATFEAAKDREAQLAAELERFARIRGSLEGQYKEKERLGQVAEATVFIRDTLKEAAPIVAKNYIRHVSVEAGQMFREITGNAEYTLKWTEDYSIILEEDGFERPFVSLSGGEQMSAALSVRLALLKQLSDIRIAFFDEPTTNMDIERRENFAQQISRITHFDQLFVISHDDTFDSYVDHVEAMERT